MDEYAIRYIECEYEPGMFSNEYAVTLTFGEDVFSMFTSRDRVIPKSPTKGLLKVKLMDEKDRLVWLPGETLEQGRRFMRVPEGRLIAA
jgi:hypothetical protein